MKISNIKLNLTGLTFEPNILEIANVSVEYFNMTVFILPYNPQKFVILPSEWIILNIC